MDTRRSNECPRCRFSYTAWNKGKAMNPSFGRRFQQNLRERPRYGWGPIGDLRFAQAANLRPFRCRCGTWLRARPWTFGWIDVIGIVVIGAIVVVLGTRYSWARGGYAFAVPIGLWVGYRVSTQIAIDEVPAPPDEDRSPSR
jgi:hypothetical protein